MIDFISWKFDLSLVFYDLPFPENESEICSYFFSMEQSLFYFAVIIYCNIDSGS